MPPPTVPAPATAAPAPTVPVIAPRPRGPLTLSDPLLADATQPLAGSSVTSNRSSGTPALWSTTPGVIRTANGATSSAPGGAHHALPAIAGTIRIRAEVRVTGSGFTGIALGHGDLSGDFWANNELLFLVRRGGFALMAGKQDLLAHADAKLLHADEPDQLELSVDSVARTVSARLNGTVMLADAALPASIHANALTAAGFRFNEPVTAGAPQVRAWQIEIASKTTSGLVPSDLATCFTTPDQPATLRWQAAAVGPTTAVPYTISDYAGTQLASGTAVVGDDDTLTITRTFPRGFYEIAFPEAQQAFGIVALPAQSGAPDPFFCIDSGLSWLDTDPVHRTALVHILARCGIAQSRERMGLGSVNPSPETYTWNRQPRAFDDLRTLYAAQQVPLLEILEGGSAHHSLGKSAPYPRELPALATSWAKVAAHWQGGWGAGEANNEPDLRGIPAEQYVPGTKAQSYALAQAGAKTPLVTGVFAGIPPGPYFDACVANGLLADSDAISFHSYDRAPGVENMVARYRTWLADSGQPNLPLWHSECGWPWVNGPARPPRDQDALSACEIATKAIETKACGVARHFPFVYVYYEEGHKNFGMMGREATPLRSMAAYAMTIATLAHQPYLGDLRQVPAPVTLTRVFGAPSDKTWVATLYTGTVDASATVHVPFPVLRAAGADGRELSVHGGVVPVPDGLTYLWLDAAAVQSFVARDTTAAKLYDLGQHPVAPARRASPVVMQFLNAETPARASSRCYLITQETAHALPLHVRIDNLGAVGVTVTPSLTLPNGSAQESAPVTLVAHGSATVTWTVDASPALDIASVRLITVSVKSSAGVQPSPLAIPFVMEGTLAQHLAAHPRQRQLPFTALDHWQANNAGHGTARFSMNDGVWRMDVTFKGVAGNWSYPKFTLSERFDATHDAGFVLRARIAKNANTVALMANPNQPDSFWCPDLFPADGQWHVVYVPFTEFKPGPNGAGMQNSRLDVASWRILAIGMGNAVEENSIEISDFLVVGDAGAK